MTDPINPAPDEGGVGPSSRRRARSVDPATADPATVDPATDPADGRYVRQRSVARLYPGPAGSPGADRIATLAAQLLGTASSTVSLVDDSDRHVGSYGLPAALAQGPFELQHSLCAQCATGGRPLSIGDARADARSATNPAVLDGVVGAFLGVPLRGDDRRVVGAVCVYDAAPRIWSQEDVRTLEQLATAAATELELAALARDYEQDRQRWDAAITAAGIGNFDWDLTTGTLLWDEPLIALFGYDGDERFDESIEAFNARVHPDDIAAVTQALQQAINTVGPYEAEYRIVMSDGSVKRIQARGHARATNSNVADHVLGSAWDVSHSRGSDELAANVLEAMPVGYLSLGPELTVTAINSVAERLLRVHRLDIVGHPLSQFVPEAEATTLVRMCRQVETTRRSNETEMYFEAPIGAWLEVRTWPQRRGVALYLTDVSGRREAQELADRVAEADRSTALALQDAMLSRLPQPDHLEIRALYNAAAVRAKVGGDWYDAVVQSGGRTVLMVGDVTGHDITAAAMMGQLRSMMRVLAWQGDDPPERILDRLDHAIAALHPGSLATAIVARVEQPEPDTGRHVVRWCSAGHPPPLLAHGDGRVEVMDARGLMLGVAAGSDRDEFVTPLPVGATLLLYTDGLIERRDESIDDGIARLVEVVGRYPQLDVEDLLASVLADMLGAPAEDDIAVLALRVNPQR